jgi:hypothetical protein
MIIYAFIEQVIFIRVVKIDGSPVYIGPFGNIIDRDLFELLLGKQF